MSRIAWGVLLAALALAAVMAHFGRATPAAAARALEAGEDPLALAEARDLVARRPVPADHLLLLATAELRTGDRKGFEQAFRLATTRGWRNEAVQLVAARSALAQGDATAAANRIAALWALGGSANELPRMTRELLALPGGPEALGTQLGRTRVWQATFLQRAPEFGTPDAIARLKAAAKASGVRD